MPTQQYIRYGASNGNGSAGVADINGLVGSVTLAAGAGMTLTPVGNTITFTATDVVPVTLTAVGSSPNPDGASLSGQALTLQPADSTHPGVLTSADWNTFNNKQDPQLDQWKQPVVAAGGSSDIGTDGGDYNYDNGAAGVGATITINPNGPGVLDPNNIIVDGVALAQNARTLFESLGIPAQNGIYIYDKANGLFIRATDNDTPTKINGSVVMTLAGGSTLANTQWSETTAVTTIGTDPMAWATAVPPAQSIATTVIDWSTGSVFWQDLSTNTTFTFSSPKSGQTIIVRLTNSASNWTVTWPTVRWAGGAQPTMSPGAVSDVYTFVDDGQNIYGSAVQNMS